jgi:Arc/MetJ-type ribon-helix-helix transcriptional regulator
MQNAFSPDIFARIDAQVTTGRFSDPNEVLHAALTALEQSQDDWAAIEAGLADMEAGRIEMFADVDAELRRKHNIPRRS